MTVSLDGYLVFVIDSGSVAVNSTTDGTRAGVGTITLSQSLVQSRRDALPDGHSQPRHRRDERAGEHHEPELLLRVRASGGGGLGHRAWRWRLPGAMVLGANPRITRQGACSST